MFSSNRVLTPLFQRITCHLRQCAYKSCLFETVRAFGQESSNDGNNSCGLNLHLPMYFLPPGMTMYSEPSLQGEPV